jgi:DNA-binding CsgD family transcriptional regulator
MEFVELPSKSDIYQFIGKRLRELVGNSFVLVNSFDETTQCIQAQAFLGARKEIESALKILKKNLMEMSFPINEEARAGLTTGKLVKVPGGLHVLSFEKIPTHICTTLEKLLNLGDIYTMGFTRKEKLFGNATIITRDRSGLEKRDLIETFIGQASVALQRRRAEEELKKYREHLEEMVEGRTAEIKAANERLQREITEHKNTEKALIESESKLQKQKSALEQKNIALGEVIAQIEVEKRRIKDDIETNINIVVSPILEKLKIEKASAKYVNLLQYHLERLTFSFGNKITKKSLKLTPREIEVCNMVKGGLTSKDISNLLNISYRTIEKHRRNIRYKLGISNKRINLTSFLREF